MEKKKTHRLEQIQEYLETENNKMDDLLHLPDVRLNLDDLGTTKVTLPTLKNPFLKILTSNAATNVDHAKHESTPKRKPRTLKSIGMIVTLINPELIEFRYSGKVEAQTPHTIGMMFKGRPSKSWELIRKLCQQKGIIDYYSELGDVRYLEDKKMYHKRWEALRKKLESKYNVKIKRRRDYTFKKILNFKGIVFRDAFTPEHEQYENQYQRDMIKADVYHSAKEDLKKQSFSDPEIRDKNNCDENYDDFTDYIA